MVVNTSFNVRGEPVVCSPEDAWRCFMRTDMDILVLENYILIKEEQREHNKAKDSGSMYANEADIRQDNIHSAQSESESKGTYGWAKYDDRIRIKEAADSLEHIQGGISSPGKVIHDIMEYDFNTPLELKDRLERFWDDAGKPYMKTFILPVTASAFKNRDESDDIELSPFNYQF